MESSRPWTTLAVLAGAFALCSLDQSTIAGMLPLLGQDRFLQPSDYLSTLSRLLLAAAIAAPIFGWIVDTRGIRSGVYYALLLTTLSQLGASAARTTDWLQFFRFGAAIGEVGAFVALGKGVAVLLAPSTRAIGFAVPYLARIAVLLCAPLFVAVLASQGKWRAVLGCTGLLTLSYAVYTVRFLRRAEQRDPRAALRAGPLSVLQMIPGASLSILLLAYVLAMSINVLWAVYVPNVLRARIGDTFHGPETWLQVLPEAAVLGALGGGWLLRAASHRWPVADARMRILGLSALVPILTAAFPAFGGSFAFSAILMFATLACFWAFSVNLYALAVETCGVECAGVAVGLLLSVYNLVVYVGVYRYPPARLAELALAGGWDVTTLCLLFSVLPITAWFLVSRLEATIARPHPAV